MSVPTSEPTRPVSDPVVNEQTLEPARRVVRNAKHAFQLVNSLREQRKKANDKNAVIERNYNGAPPLDAAQLRNAGASWRYNFSTRPMSTIIERAAPTYIAAANGLSTLTQSKLRDQSAEGQRKTLKLREITTRMIRAWLGWSDFIAQVATENCKMGYCAAVRWDSDWRVAALRQGEFCVDQRASHDESRLTMIFADRELSPNEAFKMVLENPEAAADAGWFVEEVAKAINAASPAKQNSDANSRDVAEQERQDSATDGSEAPVVEVTIFQYAELDGSVARYILKRDDGTCLFFKERVEERMPDVVRFFSANQGTGKLYSSQGLGRWLVNLGIVLDRLRCEFLDAIKITSRAVLKTAEAAKTAMQVRVASPFITVTGEGEITQMPIILPVDAYVAADKAIVGFMGEIASAYLPSQATVDDKPMTATEAAQNAQRADAIQGNLLVRFLGQLAGVVEMIQRAAFSIDVIVAAVKAHRAAKNGGRVVAKREAEMLAKLAVELGDPAPAQHEHELPQDIDEVAVLAVIEMLEAGCTAAEIIEFVQSPVADPMRQAPQILGDKLRAIAAAYPGSLYIDQAEFTRMDVQQIAGADVADALVQSPADLQASALEAQRFQMIECGQILAGEDILVSPLDDHANHFAAIKEKGASLLESFSQLPTAPSAFFVERLIYLAQHGNAHLAMREKRGEQGSELGADKSWMKKMEKELMGLKQRTEQEAQRVAAEQQQSAEKEQAMRTAQAMGMRQLAEPVAPQVDEEPQLPPGVGIPITDPSQVAPAAA